VTEAEIPVPAAAPRKCAFCEDLAPAPVPGPRYVDGKERWFCDPDCLDLFARLDQSPQVSRRQPMPAGPIAPRYEGLNAEQRDKLDEIDAEDGAPEEPKKRRPPKIGGYW